MGHGALPHSVNRTWSLQVRPGPNGIILNCPQCGRFPANPRCEPAQAVVVNHLAQHARSEPLPGHLRTCRCGEHGCHWHPRHRGCDGPITLLLARSACGRIWRLTDACRACASVTEHTATVPEPRDVARVTEEVTSGPVELFPSKTEDLMEEGLHWQDGALYG